MIQHLKHRWQVPGGYRQVLIIAFPLILSTGSWSLQHFVDRMFLTWYSPAAIAASMPAGLLNWTFISLLMGTAAYVSTFVAQYFGSGQHREIGPAMWQGIYISVLAIPLVVFGYWIAEPVFRLAGHQAEVQAMEIDYFRVLMFGAPFVVIANAISGFFSGLGRTWTVMWINILTTACNLILDYLLIFGNFGFPEMGIIGAGLATVIAMVIQTAIFFSLAALPHFNREYATLSGWRFDLNKFRRLIRFGMPSGLQYVLELFAFSMFIMMVGYIGIDELAASNIAFNINSLAFMPMFGLSMAVSILVGQNLGNNRPDLAEKATWSAFQLATSFFSALAIIFIAIPELLIWPFALEADPAEFASIESVAIILLRFIAFYCLFDGGNMIFSGALKGAGDTRFVALASVLLSWTTMLVPSSIALYLQVDNAVYWLWGFVTAYIAGLCLIFWWRFARGKWRDMRVIEEESPQPILAQDPPLPGTLLAIENEGKS